MTALIVLGLAGCGVPAAQPAAALPSFSCRLPVGSEPTGLGGFVDIPGGTFTPDSHSAWSFDEGSWLPVGRAKISPDGRTYASEEMTKDGSTAIHVVDVASGKDRAMWTVDGGDTVAGWTQNGIYFIRDASRQPHFAGPDLWLLDPTTGQQRLVAAQPPIGAGPPLFKAWTGLGGGALWTWSVSDGSPAQEFLMRVDLATGEAVKWMSAPGHIEVLGWDSGNHPFVDSGGRVMRLLGPNHAAPVESAGFQSPPTYALSAVTDDHGTWFSAFGGSIWFLAVGANRMENVATIPLPSPTPPQSDIGFQISTLLIAGDCAATT